MQKRTKNVAEIVQKVIQNHNFFIFSLKCCFVKKRTPLQPQHDNQGSGCPKIDKNQSNNASKNIKKTARKKDAKMTKNGAKMDPKLERNGPKIHEKREPKKRWIFGRSGGNFRKVRRGSGHSTGAPKTRTIQQDAPQETNLQTN